MDQLTDNEEFAPDTEVEEDFLSDDEIVAQATAALGGDEDEDQEESPVVKTRKVEHAPEPEPRPDDHAEFNERVREEARQRALIAEERRGLERIQEQTQSRSQEIDAIVEENQRYKQAFQGVQENPYQLFKSMNLSQGDYTKLAEDIYYMANPEDAPKDYEHRVRGSERDEYIRHLERSMTEKEAATIARIEKMEQRLSHDKIVSEVEHALRTVPEDLEFVSREAEQGFGEVSEQLLGIIAQAKDNGTSITAYEAAEILNEAMSDVTEHIKNQHLREPSAPTRVRGKSKTLSNHRLSQARPDQDIDEMDDDELVAHIASQL